MKRNYLLGEEEFRTKKEALEIGEVLGLSAYKTLRGTWRLE